MRIIEAWKAFAQAGTHCLAHLQSRNLMNDQSDHIDDECLCSNPQHPPVLLISI